MAGSQIQEVVGPLGSDNDLRNPSILLPLIRRVEGGKSPKGDGVKTTEQPATTEPKVEEKKQ